MRKILLIAAILALQSCNFNSEQTKTKSIIEHQLSGEAQGTTYTVKYLGEKQEQLKDNLDSLLSQIDLSLSTYIPHSLISQLNQGDSIELDKLFIEMYEESVQMTQLTDGAFDPSIAPLIEAWGFDFSDPEKLDSLRVKELLDYCGFEQFELKDTWLVKKQREAKLNFNAIAQGYSVDLMANMLNSMRIDNYFIELGGEVKVKGKNKDGVLWRVGIDRPDGRNLERTLEAIVSLDNQAMVTSGNYRKYVEIEGEKYYHTLNPKTGFPVKHNLLSATVIAEKASIADALATSFMVKGLEASKEFIASHSRYEAVLIFANNKNQLETYFSPGLIDRIEEL